MDETDLIQHMEQIGNPALLQEIDEIGRVIATLIVKEKTMKDKASAYKSAIAKSKSAARRLQQRSETSQRTAEERAEVLTVNVMIDGRLVATLHLPAKTRVGAMREELAKSLGKAKATKFKFILNGMTLEGYNDMCKTLRKSGFINGCEVEAIQIVNEDGDEEEQEDDARPSFAGDVEHVPSDIAGDGADLPEDEEEETESESEHMEREQ